MFMRIIVRDGTMSPINELDIYSSFIWTDRYASAGDFEICVPCTNENYELFNQARYITIDESDRVMVIEKRQIKTKVDDADEYIISGRSAETLLDRRVIMGTMTFGTSPYDEQTNVSASQDYQVGTYVIWFGIMCRVVRYIPTGRLFVLYSPSDHNESVANIIEVDTDDEGLTVPIEDIVKTLLNTTVINPTDRARRFVNPTWRFVPSNDINIEEIKMTASFGNTNLFDALSSLLVGAGLGCKVVYNEDKETMDFSLIKGVDHSVSQSYNMVVNFKSVLDNLVSTDFITDDGSYKTCAFVIGAEDEKKTRTISVADEYGRVSDYEYENPNYRTTWCQQVSLSGTGLSYGRREVIVDASDINRYQTIGTSSGYSNSDVPISEVDYRAMLKTRGKSELMNHYSTYNLEAEILPDMFYKFGVDYGLGDTISIEDKFGNTINASVTEMIFSVDSNGYKAYPTIETLGEVDGMDELISIFLDNPIYVNVDKTVVVPDIRSELQNLREKNYIAYYVKDIIDYFLDNNKLVYTQADGELGTMLVAPSWNDMDFVVFGGSISQIYNNPNAYPDANTKAMQFVYFMKTNQIKIDSNGIVVPPLDDLASAVQ